MRILLQHPIGDCITDIQPALEEAIKRKNGPLIRLLENPKTCIQGCGAKM